MSYNENYRENYNEDFDDDDEEYEDDGEDLSEFDQDALFFNECTLKQINHELVVLPNRELIEFLQWELDKLHFTENSELIPVGIEFEGQYLLQFYNVREDKTVKTATGAGNIHMLVDGWILKTLTDLYVAELYGEMGDVYPSDLSDCYTNILMDVLDWKREAGIEAIPSKSPDDAPREDT